MSKIQQVYKRRKTFLRVGERWNIELELQISYIGGSISWFSDSMLQVVQETIKEPCYDRVIRESEKCTDCLYRDDLLIVYNFQKIPGKSSYTTLLRVPDKYANTDVPRTRYGRYKQLPLFKDERLVVSVSLKKQSRNIKDEMDVSKEVISKYFAPLPCNDQNSNVEKKPITVKKKTGRGKSTKDDENSKKEVTLQTCAVKVVQDDGVDISKNDAEFFDEKLQEKGKKAKKKPTTKRKPVAEKSILELATDNSESKQVHSDDDQFEEKSQKNIKRKGGKRLTTKSKKPKTSNVEKQAEVDDDLPASGVVATCSKDTQNDRLPPSSVTSLEDLIESKKKGDDDFLDMPDITTVSKDTSLDETIDLDNYGEVSLDDVNSLTELSPEQIRDLVRSMEDDLKDILKGKVFCERHQLYKEGGRSRDALSMHVQFGNFSLEQEQALTKVLMDTFCAKKSTYFDYVMKVLLPETMIMIHQKVSGTTREEALKAFMV